MRKVALFGAGEIGLWALGALSSSKDEEVVCFIDNDKQKQGTCINSVPVISFEEYKKISDDVHLLLTCNTKNREQIISQILGEGNYKFEIFDFRKDKRERIVSYSHDCNLEDVILYNVFRDEKDIFYIDVGSNDPFLSSVTKLLYDVLGATGINIEPQKRLYDITCKERPKDININVALGEEHGFCDLYVQGGVDGEISTVLVENIVEELYLTEKVEVYTLTEICNEYVKENQKIHFLKIDVEGFEESVLRGMDFSKYRPQVIVIESTLPMTFIPCHEKWEDIILNNDYSFTFSHGVNRYYVANECEFLIPRFLPINQIKMKYAIYHASMSQIS